MNSDEKEVVTKQLKYAPKRKGGEENQNLWTDARMLIKTKPTVKTAVTFFKLKL